MVGPAAAAEVEVVEGGGVVGGPVQIHVAERPLEGDGHRGLRGLPFDRGAALANCGIGKQLCKLSLSGKVIILK